MNSCYKRISVLKVKFGFKTICFCRHCCLVSLISVQGILYGYPCLSVLNKLSKFKELDSNLERTASASRTTEDCSRFLRHLKFLEHLGRLFLVNTGFCFSSVALVSFMQYIISHLPGSIKTHFPSVLLKSAW